MKFTDLLSYEDYVSAGWDGPELCQREARRKFPSVAREHGLVVGTNVGPPSGPTTHVVIGVSPAYAVLDLELLDDLSAALRERTDERIELFDMDEHPAEFEALARGSQIMAQTPVVAVWEGGTLVQTAAGWAARELLRTRYLGRA